MIVWAIQWQLLDEPWGWESLMLFPDEALALEAWGRGGLEALTDQYRLVSIPVLERLPDDLDAFLITNGDAQGVVVVRGDRHA